MLDAKILYFLIVYFVMEALIDVVNF